MIKAFNIRKLRNGEFLSFLANVLQIIQGNTPKDLWIDTELETLKTTVAEADVLFKKVGANDLTDELIELDRKRDYLIVAIQKLIEARVSHYEEDTARHGRLLYDHMQQYGKSIAREAYQNETAILKGLVRDWEQKPDLAGAIKALELETWVTKLKDANTLFNDKFVARAKVEGTVVSESFSTKRAQVMDAYTDVRSMLNAWLKVKHGEAPFAQVAAEINGLIDRYIPLTLSRTPTSKAEENTVEAPAAS